MDQIFDFLSDDDILKLKILIQAFDQSSFNFIELKRADFSVTLGREGSNLGTSLAFTSSDVQRSIPQPRGAESSASRATKSPSTPEPVSFSSTDDYIPITAPMMGRFYARPDPGSEPFISIGTSVTNETTVAIIEVMKVFSAIRAGTIGIITAMCVEDGQVVELGQELFRVRPG